MSQYKKLNSIISIHNICIIMCKKGYLFLNKLKLDNVRVNKLIFVIII